MNEVLEAILTRRSVRKFKRQQITQAELDAVLQAALYAATSCGRQGTKFVAVQDPTVLAALARGNRQVTGKTIDPLYGAPTDILVFSDSRFAQYVEDGSLAIGNMMLAAHALGLGSCWIHDVRETFELEEFAALKRGWGIEDYYVGVGSCILGYPDERPQAAKRKPGRVTVVEERGYAGKLKKPQKRGLPQAPFCGFLDCSAETALLWRKRGDCVGQFRFREAMDDGGAVKVYLFQQADVMDKVELPLPGGQVDELAAGERAILHVHEGNVVMKEANRLLQCALAQRKGLHRVEVGRIEDDF